MPGHALNPKVAGYKVTAGTITGKLGIAASGTTLKIKGFENIAPGTTTIRIWVGHDAAAGTAGTVTAKLGTKNIFTFGATVALLATNTIASVERYRDYLYRPRPIATGGSGYLSINFKTTSTIGTTDKIFLTVPSLFGTFFDFYTRCKFVDLADPRDSFFLAKSCNWRTLIAFDFSISMPNTQALSDTKHYRLEIYHVGEQNFGVKYPSTPSDYEFNVALKTSANAVKEEFVTTLELRQQAPTETCFKNFLSNSDKKNVFMMRFNPSVTISSAGFLRFYFPTSVFKGTTGAAS